MNLLKILPSLLKLHWELKLVTSLTDLQFCSKALAKLSSNKFRHWQCLLPRTYNAIWGVILKSFQHHPSNDEKWHCKSSLSHSWIEWSRTGYNIFDFFSFFLAICNTFLWQNCADNSTFNACFHISSANKCTKRHTLPARKYVWSTQGLWCTQLFWCTHYKGSPK